MSTASSAPLVDAYDLVIFDLDGVVYLIDRPIPAAVTTIRRMHAEGRALAYATNNASRRSAEVAELLTGMGIAAGADEVLTSGAAAADVLAERLPAGSRVLVVGADALRAEVRAAGLVPVELAEEEPVAVVQGYGPRVGWADLAEAAVAVRGGASWIATNTDRTLPSPRGPVPGNGSLVAALRHALGREPDLVVGKPEPALFDAAARRVGASRPLVVGDRLDTDIEGAVRAGMDSLLVLTGVNTVLDLLNAPPALRPTCVAIDVGGLFDEGGAVRVPGDQPASGAAGGEEWRVTADGAVLRLSGSGTTLGALRELCAVAWSVSRVDGAVDAVDGASDDARKALRDLGLAD